ncbi:MAG TPA: type II CAAX endopeptidase family protein [Vicinamibacterales bacterium]|nr:type II CAAX endopeptidase family protein [Vicinamibacterales bacterium]
MMLRRPVATDRIATPSAWIRLLTGFLAVFLLFDLSARALGSTRAQQGLLVGAIVLLATLGLERLVAGASWAGAVRSLGLGRPAARAMAAASAASVLLLGVPAIAWMTGTSIELTPDWLALAPGFFAQAGVAEEVLFRGYLFGHLRHGRSFWRAAWLSMPPFVAVHLLMFVSTPSPIALASVLLATVTSFPLAWLFEIGGRTIWAPALVHAVIQGTIKVLVLPAADSVRFSLLWMVASALVPLVVFLVSRVGETLARKTSTREAVAVLMADAEIEAADADDHRRVRRRAAGAARLAQSRDGFVTCCHPTVTSRHPSSPVVTVSRSMKGNRWLQSTSVSRCTCPSTKRGRLCGTSRTRTSCSRRC